ncbi:MAG: FAD:protein FMN transferase ApbE [Ignavibacteriae bacterium HGW-Ignavibacteriae-2]|jgi:thiamine biosynthesis lipoprotein|nr:MAG: FAD:protein FMN transferase ApbE [Ignavibacteriae bacterium HGW-Ignavibacteriae-2]
MKKLLILLILSFLTGCSKEDEQNKLISLSGRTMGTTYSVKFIADKNIYKNNSDFVQPKIDSVLQDVNNKMSTYIPSSEISKFNSSASLDWLKVSRDFVYVISVTRLLGFETNGALDLTIGPLVNLWGFGPSFRPNIIPTENEINSARRNIGLEKIEVDENNSQIRKTIPSLYCDLSSTAKGFGVDKVAELLDKLKIPNYLVEIGGEVKVKGKNHYNKLWQVGISEPDISGKIQKVLPLNNLAMATSGDYWNYFEENGVRYSHLIDPRTGKPIDHKLASVTVIHKECIIADGYATAISIMGHEEGYKFAVKKELPVFMIVRENNTFVVKQTPAFEKMFESKEG